MRIRTAAAAIVALAAALSAVTALALRSPSRRSAVLLPTGWRLSAPQGAVAATETFPQGLALSPDGRMLAVANGGYRTPALQLFATPTLRLVRTVRLRGAFGAPIWFDAATVAVAGANADGVIVVNARTGTLRVLPTGTATWPVAVARSPRGDLLATANDGDGSVTILRHGRPIARARVGAHPAALAFFDGGRFIAVAVRGGTQGALVVLDAVGRVRTSLPLRGDPCALAVEPALLDVALCDADRVVQVADAGHRIVRVIGVGLHAGRLEGAGASPNALAYDRGTLYVSLDAQNAIAVVRDHAVAGYLPTGWYPSGIAVGRDALYVSDAKGERSPANPDFRPFGGPYGEYIASALIGSVRRIPLRLAGAASLPGETALVIANAMPRWTPPPGATVVRPGGPIHHVIYVIKENRSYDQVLGDLGIGDGDPHLAWFGATITPNQHAIARRFGDFDRAFADGQVSADGHSWTDAAFSPDYTERFWPANYAKRRALYDFQDGRAPIVPQNGYLWDAAARAGISYRDYGEDTVAPTRPGASATTTFPGLVGHFDPHYYGWDLRYPDLARYREWLREFRAFERDGNLPALEIVYLPNDHTAATDPGFPTPQAYVAQNDYAFGLLVQAVSHSRFWHSTAIFAIEDDAQDGPDHVDDQRTTLYLASPYARGGVIHDRYSTASVLRTIELILGLPPLSIYDAVAPPLYAAFTTRADLRPYTAIRPHVEFDALNTRAAYGARRSAAFDWSRPDAVPPRLFDAVLAGALGKNR